MKRKLFYGLAAFAAVSTAHSQVVINELDADTPGTDALEFVELYDGGTGSTSLDGLVLVFYNGNGDVAYDAYDLDGLTTDANGYFVIGAVAGANLAFNGTGATDKLQNGADAVALYTDDGVNFPNGTAVTATNLVNAIVYGTNDPEDTGLTSVLGGPQFNESDNSNKDEDSIQRNPDGAATFIVAPPTPGASNDQDPFLNLSLDPSSISEGDGAAAILAEVTVLEPVVGNLTVNIMISDGTELSGPMTVTILDGDDFATFDLDAVDDGDVDGIQSVDVTVSATGYQDAVASAIVADDDLVLPEIVINEMQTKASGDDPQFVELYNNDSSPVDIAGWSVKAYESESADGDYGSEVGSFTIPSGSPVNLAPGAFYLVGDAVFESIYGITPDLQAEPGFGLFDITMILFDESGNEVFVVLSSDNDVTNQANNAGAVTVADISISDGNFSPAGFFLDTDGGSFASLVEFTPQPASSATPGSSNETPLVRLRMELDGSFFSEADGAGVVTATITRVNNTSGALDVTVSSGDISEVVFQSTTVSFADGEVSQTVLLDAVDDGDEDGLQTVVLTASAGGFIDGTATVSVADDETSSGASDILFTQYYEGSSSNKYVEISNTGSSAIPLDGWSLTRWSNANTENWKTATSGASSTLDLSGTTIPAGGTIVIANASAAVAGVTPDISDGVINHNGDDSLVLYNGALNPANVADSLSFTDAGNEGANTSFVRATLDQGWNTDSGSNITDFPAVWVSVDTATVDAAVTGDTNFLGFFELGEPSSYNVSVESCSAAGGQFVISFTATGSSDVYVTSDLQNWNPATNGTGVASGTYTDTAPPAGKAFYLIQEAGSPAP